MRLNNHQITTLKIWGWFFKETTEKYLLFKTSYSSNFELKVFGEKDFVISRLQMTGSKDKENRTFQTEIDHLNSFPTFKDFYEFELTKNDL